MIESDCESYVDSSNIYENNEIRSNSDIISPIKRQDNAIFEISDSQIGNCKNSEADQASNMSISEFCSIDSSRTPEMPKKRKIFSDLNSSQHITTSDDLSGIISPSLFLSKSYAPNKCYGITNTEHRKGDDSNLLSEIPPDIDDFSNSLMGKSVNSNKFDSSLRIRLSQSCDERITASDNIGSFSSNPLSDLSLYDDIFSGID